ncbi:MAG TPA: coniferyl aldehyde dehydrogenase [Polyangiaceae bacterium]|jgi:coniferyl-aldehyde dehydrogenase|nr:coniferyl aldehyde dehydrogenase [Polyangiaceae bacterium]
MTAAPTSSEPSSAPAKPGAASASTSVEDLGSILARLRAAGLKAGAPSYEARIDALEKLERAIHKRKDAMTAAVSRDFGNRSKHETLVAEIFVLLGEIEHAKQNLRDWMEPEDRQTGWQFLPATCQIVYQPLGVVGVISPWNYPISLALGPLVAALAAGNRAMLKPSELVPETAELLRDLVAETFPDDQVVVVTGGPEVGEAFAKLPFDHLVFTGSTRVGKIVMRAASDNLVPVTLELGGKSPTIVGTDFDVKTAAERIMAGKTFNAGQTCIAPDYALVPAASRDAFVDACKAAVTKMFPTLAKNPDYTSVVNDRHYARLRGLVDDAKSHGATVVELNPGNETFDPAARKMSPTLVLDPTEEMLCMQDEIFGPVMPIMTYTRIDEAIAYVNAHPRPLALYYFGHGRAGTERVLNETISGGVTINETMLHFAQEDLPFGGVGPSGMGAYHAREGFRSLSMPKPIFRQSRINTRGFLLPPYGKMADRLLGFLIGR